MKKQKCSELVELRKELQDCCAMRSGAGPRWDYHTRALKCETARLLIHRCYELQKRNPSIIEARELWLEAVKAFNQFRDECFPATFWNSVDLLRNGDSAGLEAVIEFLEADPWFDTSGYIKADLIRYMNRMELPEQHTRSRIEAVVTLAVDSRDRREFRSYCRLARKVDSADLRTLLLRRLESDDEGIRRRAGWVLAYLDATLVAKH